MALDGSSTEPTLLDRATDLLSHRGPDDRGTFLDGPVALGFRRLAIVDLTSAGHQPMLSADGRHAIVFNGEIYNWRELRSELQSLGHSFRSNSDTEVLLAAWRQWGADCLARLNGMWAFLVWDARERTLFGARDRFGVKPLFVARDAHRVAFASEIKALRPLVAGTNDPDTGALADLVAYACFPTREATFNANVRQVPAATWFALGPDGAMRTQRFWSILDAPERTEDGLPSSEFADLFADSVRLRMRSDVPVGVLLSGGLDSTAIICEMARARPPDGGALLAFNFPSAEFDETEQVNATLRQTGAERVSVAPSAEELWQRLPAHLRNQDEPVYSATSLVVDLLCRNARARGVKVLLNGQGADETMAGYPSFVRSLWAEWLLRGRIARLAADVRGTREHFPRLAASSLQQALRDVALGLARSVPGYRRASARSRDTHLAHDGWLSEDARAGIVARAIERADAGGHHHAAGRGAFDRSRLAGLMHADLPLYLRMEDRNSMAHGVEVRLPFLDFRVAELAFGVPGERLVQHGVGKQLLREATRGRIPEVVRARREKLGFPVPVNAWFRGAWYEPARDLLASRTARECGFLDADRIGRVLEGHRRSGGADGARLFHVVQSLLWLEQRRQDAAVSA